MTYEYGSIDKQQNLSVDPTVVFQTVNAAVQLKNSLGNLIDQGTVQYYAGAWRTFGTTSNGVAYKELLPINYSFRMTYEFVSKDKQQNLNTNPVVDFNTVLCTVKVTNSTNQPLSNVDVKYYSGAWRDFGVTNIDGIATKELLPANLSFRASYENVSLNKQQDISVNNLVEILLNIAP
jgi:predicted HicB family RNase H-like nuclease